MELLEKTLKSSDKLVFARCVGGDKNQVLLVKSMKPNEKDSSGMDGQISTINLAKSGIFSGEFAMDIFSRYSFSELKNHRDKGRHGENVENVEYVEETHQISSLLAAFPGTGKSYCGGMNYRDHAAETRYSSNDLLVFPKIADFTPSFGSVEKSERLLDYEVELGVVFDRDIKSLGDLNDAYYGYFVANDLTDRSVQIMMSRSGSIAGFAQAKSFIGAQPVGPFLVVPRRSSRKEFEASLDLSLYVNGECRQRSNTSMLLHSVDQLVEKLLNRGGQVSLVGGREVLLLDGGYLKKGAGVLTGTPGGIAFAAPSLPRKLLAAAWRIGDGADIVGNARRRIIAQEKRNTRYLQVGDLIEARIDGIGGVSTKVL